VGREDSGPAAALAAAWFGLRAEDRGAAAVALHALRSRMVAVPVTPSTPAWTT